VRRDLADGFAQLSQGKQGPLVRMSVGDWFVYYSPSTDFRGGKPLRAFTGIGKAVHRAVGEDWRNKGAVPPAQNQDPSPLPPV